MASTAEKLDPELWEEAKADAREKFGGHSARAMQYAVKLYKERGGRYRGKKQQDNRLAQWAAQDWTTKSGRPSRETGERYLPRDAIAALTPAEYGATTRAKRAGGGVGQSVAQPKSIREKTRKFRKVNPMPTPAQIAARKKFAERARSGELAKMRKKSTRKKNPTATRAPARNRTKLMSNGERKKNPIVKTFPAYGPFRFKVETSKDGVKFMNPVGFPRKINAINYAKMLAEKNPDLFIRVYELTASDLSYAV